MGKDFMYHLLPFKEDCTALSSGISFIAPCFNEEEAIPIYYKRVSEIVEAMDKNLHFEFIFVDDGSKDKTIEIIKQLQAKDERVHFISFSRNFGKESAMLAGLEASNTEFVTVMDVDLQDQPALIPKMFEYVKSGEVDYAVMNRTTRKGEPIIRSIFAKLYYILLAKITGLSVVSGARDFLMANRKVTQSILSMPEHFRFLKCIYLWVGFKAKWFEVENVPRAVGVSKWTFWKLFAYAVNSFIVFSQKPLLLAYFFSFITFLAGIIWAAYLAINKFVFGIFPNGWQILSVIILIGLSLQFLVLAIFGQYLARVYTETKRRPQYFVKEMK
jgi:glycosyltransferase involved in cell wall biosynthesis